MGRVYLGSVPGRPGGRHQGREPRSGRGRRVPAPVRPGGGRGPGGQRDLHRAGRGQRAGRATRRGWPPRSCRARRWTRWSASTGRCPSPPLWPLLAGLTEALAAIHACGVVHRDLKPANVLLATDGPRVIDFGISRATDGTVLTATGVVFGTPGYMSPEQAEGKAAGPASDMFALGCVIAYAATGAGPFGTGTAAAVLYRVVHGEAGPGRGAAGAAGDRLRVPGQGPGRSPGARGAGRRDRGPGPRHWAVRGGVLAAAGGQRDRRLSGPAGAGTGGLPAACRGVLMGRRRAPGDRARSGGRRGGPRSRARRVIRRRRGINSLRVFLDPRVIPAHRDTARLRATPSPRVTAGRRGRRRRRAATCRTLSRRATRSRERSGGRRWLRCRAACATRSG